MYKYDTKPGDQLIHKGLGRVLVTEESLECQMDNLNEETVFVDHDGEIKEVSKHLLYHTRSYAPLELIQEDEEMSIREDMIREGLL